jgi:protein-tyrosine phosphatase
VIDLTAEEKEANPFRERARYFSLPVMDLTPPDAALCRQACAIIREQLADGAVVYIHCLLGLGRGGAIAVAWMVESGCCGSAPEAGEALRRLEPLAVVGH